jgi:hypothetical protein
VKPYKILRAANADLDAAAAWYEQQLEGLGLELVQEFRQRLALALEAPGGGDVGWSHARWKRDSTLSPSEVQAIRNLDGDDSCDPDHPCV